MTDWSPIPVKGRRARRRSGIAVFALRGGQTVVALVSAVILALTCYGWMFLSDINEGLATTDVFGQQVQAKPLDGAVDILLVGQDSRTDNQGNSLPREVLDMLHAGEADGERQTDTMILMHIPQDGRRAVAFSFPRDSYVEINGGFGKHKLNSAYVYAYNDTSKTLQQQGETDLKEVDEQAKIAGRKNLIATIEQFIGKPGMIDRYAEVNLSSFYEVTKSIGGIDVCLNAPAKERKSGIDLPAGKQTVQGVQALAFVRQRYDLPNGDLDRIARQQAFLSGLANRVLSPDVLANPIKISELIEAVKKSVVLSAGWDLLEFAQQMRGLTGGNVEFRTIPVLGLANIGGADVVRVDPAQVQSFVAGLVTDGGQPQSTGQTPSGQASGSAKDVTVELFNATGDSRIGNNTLQLLQGKGFKVGGPAQLATRSSSVVRHAPGEEAGAAALVQALGGKVQTEPDADVAAGHLRVLLGKDFHGTPSQVNQQVPRSSSSTTTPPSSSTPAEPPAKPITAGGVPCVN
ncbi:LCP family protein [Amycolatopsis nigrescens]|uniref:LCP family protein n=1 Tax=Amycolatopsis nigrescens TaxID=381445 RepID=UPI000370B65F|nr:LCP family protein [Amycolatopsis nigrescens]